MVQCALANTSTHGGIVSDSGELTPTQQQKAISWLRSRGAPKLCPACGHNNWTIGGHIVMPMTWTG